MPAYRVRSPLRVQIVSDGVRRRPVSVYLAPAGTLLGPGAGGTAALSRGAPENHVRPAISHLFRSLAEKVGDACATVLLTAMGRNGAEELKLLRRRSAVTIPRDRDSSVVHGTPDVAIALGAAVHVLRRRASAPARQPGSTTRHLPGGRTDG